MGLVSRRTNQACSRCRLESLVRDAAHKSENPDWGKRGFLVGVKLREASLIRRSHREKGSKLSKRTTPISQ
jgi:hypothetical protein